MNIRASRLRPRGQPIAAGPPPSPPVVDPHTFIERSPVMTYPAPVAAYT